MDKLSCDRGGSGVENIRQENSDSIPLALFLIITVKLLLLPSNHSNRRYQHQN